MRRMSVMVRMCQLAARAAQCGSSTRKKAILKLVIISVDRPAARRDQLYQVTIGVAEINAMPAARPRHTALDRNVQRGEARLPISQRRGGNRKRQVQFARAIVRGNVTPRARRSRWMSFHSVVSPLISTVGPAILRASPPSGALSFCAMEKPARKPARRQLELETKSHGPRPGKPNGDIILRIYSPCLLQLGTYVRCAHPVTVASGS